MPANSRIKVLADQIVLTTSEGDAGALIFESGNVNGSPATVLRSALIGDLTVDTLQLQNESVTLPETLSLGSDVSVPGLAGSGPSAWYDVLEDDFTFTAPNGTLVQIMVLADLFMVGQSGVAPSMRLFLDNTTALDQFSGPGDTTIRNFIRFVIHELTATGSPQNVNLKWQIQSSNINNPVAAKAGSHHLRVAFKR